MAVHLMSLAAHMCHGVFVSFFGFGDLRSVGMPLDRFRDESAKDCPRHAVPKPSLISCCHISPSFNSQEG